MTDLQSQDKTVLDLVKRKGPIRFDDLMNQIGHLSRDKVHESLAVLEAEGLVAEEEEKHEDNGVEWTRDVWVSKDAGDRDV